MADETATTEGAETNTADATSTTETSATEPLGDAGKKALDAERKERRAAEKRASDFEARLKQFEDRDKTEAQKLAERAEVAEKRALELETRSMRLEIASEKGLSPAQTKRLIGSTREELEADAVAILEEYGPAKDDTTETVVTSLDLGTRGKATAATGDPGADFAKFINGQLKAAR